MIEMSHRLEHNRKEVAATVIDGEAIFINLSNGTYYSADQVGGVVCALIEKNFSFQEIINEITRCYDVSSLQAQEDLQNLLQEMIQENLIFVSPSLERGEAYQVELANGRMGYIPPKLCTYRDMGDLLALDPPMPGLTEIPWYGSKGNTSK